VIQPHHAVQADSGRTTSDNPRAGFVGDPRAGLFYHPVVVDGVRHGDRIVMEETFGPIVGVTTYTSLSEAIELANAPGYGLSSSIYTTDPNVWVLDHFGI
jgi:alpha-ketoglutaric semialdehyde dehydrogenase